MAKHYTSTFNTRQTMAKTGLEIFFYEDTKLSPVSSHSHEHYEFYFFLSGNVSILIGGNEYTLQNGDICIIPPGIYHRPVFRSQSEIYRRIVLWMEPEYMRLLKESCDSIDACYSWILQKEHYHFHLDQGTSQRLFTRLFELLEEYQSDSSFHEELLRCHSTAFLLQINRMVKEFSLPAHAKKPKALFSQICDYIHSHLEDDLSLDVLAEKFYVSKYYVAHCFKENMGESTHQYILKARLHATKSSILSGMPLNEVATNYGFANYTTFFRAFKKEFGISPRDFKDSYNTLNESPSDL